MLARLLAPVVFFVLLLLGAVFLSVLFVAGAVVAAAVWGWLWWKTRELRRQGVVWPPRDAQGQVIEGEYTVHEHEETRDALEEPPPRPKDDGSPR